MKDDEELAELKGSRDQVWSDEEGVGDEGSTGDTGEDTILDDIIKLCKRFASERVFWCMPCQCLRV